MHRCVVEYFWSAIGLCMHSPSANNSLKSFLSISQKFFAWSWLDLNSSAANSLNSTAMRTFCLPARSFPLTNKKLLPLSSLLPLQPSNVHNSPLLRSRKNILPFPTPPLHQTSSNPTAKIHIFFLELPWSLSPRNCLYSAIFLVRKSDQPSSSALAMRLGEPADLTRRYIFFES